MSNVVNWKTNSTVRTLVFLVLVLFTTSFAMKKDVPVVDFSYLESILDQRNDTTYIVNFWATWCSPCVKELPAFEKLHEKFDSKKVKVILVSLDFPKQLESHLIPFIEEKQLRARVIILNDPNNSVWIDKVDKNWSGAIPATVIFNKEYYGFFEQSFNYDQLEEIVNKIIIK